MTGQDGDDPTAARVDALWRRQLVLVGVAAVLIVLCLVLMAMARSGESSGAVTSATADATVPAGRADRSMRLLVWPAVAGALAAVVLLGAVVAHIVRVASFTFRRAPGE